MRRSIPPGCVARRLNSLLFALLAPCHAGASTPENVKLFLREPLVRWVFAKETSNHNCIVGILGFKEFFTIKIVYFSPYPNIPAFHYSKNPLFLLISQTCCNYKFLISGNYIIFQTLIKPSYSNPHF